MSESTLIWLFGILGAWCLALTIAIYGGLLVIFKLKAILILTSKRAADILHSPDDHLGIDELLEKYKARHNELSYSEWEELKNRCNQIVGDPSISKSERLLALFVVEFSLHKLQLKPMVKPQ